MDRYAVGSRIKAAREAKKLTQEELAEMVELTPTHISVIERGAKTPRLSTFVDIANALDVSADFLLQDVVDRSTGAVYAQLTQDIMQLPAKQRTRILNAIRALME